MVSIILVNYFQKKYLKKCLQSIKQNKGIEFEIIIVNNSAKESLGDIKLENPRIRIIKARNLGYGRGNNLGSKYARGEYLVFLNPDSIVSKNWLKKAIRVFSKKNAGVVMSKILSLDGKIINSFGGELHYTGFSWSGGYGHKNINNKDPYEVAYASGTSLFIKKNLFQRLGGFDPDFFLYVEDLDLSFRARLLGERVFCAPKSIVFHDYQFKKGDYKLFYLERNRLFFILKNYSLRMIFLIFFPLFFLDLMLWFYFIIIGKFKVKFKAWVYFFKFYPRMARKRKRIQKSRELSDSRLIKFFKPKIETKVFDNFLLRYLINPVLALSWIIIKAFLK